MTSKSSSGLGGPCRKTALKYRHASASTVFPLQRSGRWTYAHLPVWSSPLPSARTHRDCRGRTHTPGGVHEAVCCYQAASGSGLEASLAGHTVLLLIQFSDQRLHESLYYLSLTVSFYYVAQAGLRLQTLFLCLSRAGIIGSGRV